MRINTEAAIVLHKKLLNIGNTISVNAQQLKQRIQRNSIRPVEPNNINEIASKVCKDYIDWMMELPRFYERFPSAGIGKNRSFGVDPVLMHAWVGGGIGKFLNDSEMLRVMDDILNESQKKMEKLCIFDPLKSLELHSILSIRTNSDEALVVCCGEVKSVPLSKNDQYVVALEYILRGAQDHGVSHTISKNEVWQFILQWHEKHPFKRPPQDKDLNAMRLSVDRHLKRIEVQLKKQFPTLKQAVIFQTAEKEGCFLLRI